MSTFDSMFPVPTGGRNADDMGYPSPVTTQSPAAQAGSLQERLRAEAADIAVQPLRDLMIEAANELDRMKLSRGSFMTTERAVEFLRERWGLDHAVTPQHIAAVVDAYAALFGDMDAVQPTAQAAHSAPVARSKIAFMDGIDWQHHVGEDKHPLSIYARAEDVEMCGPECGVVRVQITELDWPVEQQRSDHPVTQPSPAKSTKGEAMSADGGKDIAL